LAPSYCQEFHFLWHLGYSIFRNYVTNWKGKLVTTSSICTGRSNILNGCSYTPWPVQEIVERNAVSEEPSMPTRETDSEDIGRDYPWQDQGHTIQTKISGIISVNCILCFQQSADLLVYLCHCGYIYRCRSCPTLESFSKQPMEMTILRIRITEVYSLQLLSCLMHILDSLNSHYSSLSFVAEGSVHTRQPARRSLLVLGDEPKCRRQAYSRPGKKKPTATFNHCMCPSLRLIFKYPIVFVSYEVLQSTSGEGWAL
jgi:hypothetical protein